MNFSALCTILETFRIFLPQYGKNWHITPNISECHGLYSFGSHICGDDLSGSFGSRPRDVAMATS